MANRDLPMMPWFPRDFIASTRHLAFAERSLYRELLDYQWELGRLPTNEVQLSRLVGLTVEEFTALWAAIADKFELIDGGYLNNSLERKRLESMELKQARSKGAQSANARRYAQRPVSDTLSDQSPIRSATSERSPPSPSPSPSPSEEKKQELSLVMQDGKKPDKKGCRVPEPFVVTSDMRRWAEQNYPTLDVDRATQNFVDFWKGKAGKEGVKLDWEATWRNGMTSRSTWAQMQQTRRTDDPNRGIDYR
jgi:uncharacterized protein YdaU (DUF1376 family)